MQGGLLTYLGATMSGYLLVGGNRRDLPILSILKSTYPFSWNFNFRRNLSDFKIEDLERLMYSLTCLHLSPFTLDARTWSLSSLGYLQ